MCFPPAVLYQYITEVALAQPFRMLAHNGEINTIEGNRNWSKARTPKLSSPLLPDLHSVTPLVNESGSDSSSLDNMLELLVTGGVELPKALRMLIPPAWQNIEDIDPDLRRFTNITRCTWSLGMVRRHRFNRWPVRLLFA